MKLLIIDDNIDYRKIICAIFKDRGWETEEAKDGVEGLQKAKETKPDLIIADAMMPKMDGFQFLREFKRSSLGRTAVIFCTGMFLKPEHEELALSLGADAYIIKPLDPDEVFTKAMNVMEQRREPMAKPGVGTNEEYLRKYADVIRGKLEEKVRELEKKSEDYARMQEELKTLKQPTTGIAKVTSLGAPPVAEREKKFELADDATLPLKKIIVLCDGLISCRERLDEQGRLYIDQICRSPEKLTAIFDRAVRLPVSRSEIFTPLKRLDVMIEMLHKDYGNRIGDDGIKMAEEIKDALAVVGEEFEGLLKLWQVATRPLKKEQVNLSELAKEEMLALRPEKRETERKATLTIKREIIANCDRSLLQLALEGLLENALASADQKVAELEFGFYRSEASAYYFVRDNGSGETAKMGDRLFIPFERLPHGASGVSLAVAKTAITRHGGKIWAETPQAKGSEIRFTLSTP